MFDILKYRDVIERAAWEAGSPDVAVRRQSIESSENEPSFILSSEVSKRRDEVRDVFMKIMIDAVEDDCVCHAVVMPRVSQTRRGLIRLIIDGAWVYG